MSSLGGVHRLSVSPQRPFSSPASLQKQADLGLARSSKWSSTAGVPRALPEPSPPTASASKQLICLLKGITAWGRALQRHSPSLSFGWYSWFRTFWVSKEFWVRPATHITLNIPTFSFTHQSTVSSFNLILFPRHFPQPFLSTANIITLSHPLISIWHISPPTFPIH